jgi:hypothetical protein
VVLALIKTSTPTIRHHGLTHGRHWLFEGYSKALNAMQVFI